MGDKDTLDYAAILEVLQDNAKKIAKWTKSRDTRLPPRTPDRTADITPTGSVLTSGTLDGPGRDLVRNGRQRTVTEEDTLSSEVSEPTTENSMDHKEEDWSDDEVWASNEWKVSGEQDTDKLSSQQNSYTKSYSNSEEDRWPKSEPEEVSQDTVKQRYSVPDTNETCPHCQRERRDVPVQTIRDTQNHTQSQGTQTQTFIFYVIVPQITWNVFTGFNLQYTPYFWLGIL